MKKLIALLACLSLSLHIVGCTSSDSKEDSEEVAAEESLDGASLDGDLESVESSEVAESNEGFLDEQLPEDALGESSTITADTPPPAIEDAPPVDSFATTDSTDGMDSGTPDGFSAPPPVDETSSTASTDTTSDSYASSDTSTDTSSSFDSSSSTAATASSELGSSASSEEPAKVSSPLRKVETMPMRRAGQLLNGVYVARPGDTWKKISQMIYGTETRNRDLAAANAWISGQPRSGDKIYYNSPQRPTDDTRLLNYYEDMGMVPDVYIAKDGDNLRTVSKDLLGYDNAWKEIWATNASVDSKSDLPAGTELRYWRSAPAPMTPPPAQDVAMSPPPEMAPPAMDMPPPPPADFPPPPDMAMNEMPPPPPPAEMMPPPPPDLPPPPPAEAVNPPPPPVAQESMDESVPADQDTMMLLGGGAIVAAGLALLLVVRKRRQQREMAAAFNDTHVG